MNKTSIEWVKNPDGTQGYTWNPLTGCLNHVEGNCRGGNFPCYAYRLANGRCRISYIRNFDIALPHENPKVAFSDPFYPRFWPERVASYFDGHRKPRGVFVCDMGDLFGIGVPEEWQQAIFTTIKAFPQDRFYLLTKRPENLIKFSPFPPNCWVGVTVTSGQYLMPAIQSLNIIDARVKYLSCEPLLGPIPLGNLANHLNQVIIGAQTKPTVYPKLEWIDEIIGACDKAGVKVFLKNNLKSLFSDDIEADGYNQLYFCGDELRQELPK